MSHFGMPFIRYRNGDLAVAAAPGACACGRAHARLASVEGRETDALRDREGRRVGGMIVNLLVSPIAGADDAFQAVQHADGSITFRLVPGPEFGDRAVAVADGSKANGWQAAGKVSEPVS